MRTKKNKYPTLKKGGVVCSNIPYIVNMESNVYEFNKTLYDNVHSNSAIALAVASVFSGYEPKNKDGSKEPVKKNTRNNPHFPPELNQYIYEYIRNPDLEMAVAKKIYYLIRDNLLNYDDLETAYNNNQFKNILERSTSTTCKAFINDDWVKIDIDYDYIRQLCKKEIDGEYEFDEDVEY